MEPSSWAMEILPMEDEPFRFFNPFALTSQKRNRLPHWEQEGVLYFVTFRLADSIPSTLLESWKTERAQWLEGHPPPWTLATEREYHRRFTGSIDRWLDAGHGSCLLRHDLARAEVMSALRHFDGVRCRMVSYVVMPNHVHSLFVLNPQWKLADLVHSWKRYSAQQINQAMKLAGSRWQKDYFDRIVRDGEHLENCIRYIRRNPVKAGLHSNEYELYESELAKAVI